MRSSPNSPETLDVAAGAVHLRWMRAGSTVLLRRGRVQIDAAPCLLGEAVVRPRIPLHAGAAWRCEHGGWVALHAIDAARAEVLAPLPLRSRLERALASGLSSGLAQLADGLDAAARALRRRAVTGRGTIRAPQLPQSA